MTGEARQILLNSLICQALTCRNWHLALFAPVAGLHRARPSATLDKRDPDTNNSTGK